ncbi:hypothetical protein ANAPC1_00372 [Anaplasma phagocytophilum]|uniref:Uncharacterized protein n=4 Tax=Anaplasma phagocytophilum TaxID=948 RepID=A0AA45USN3_ANAPH|nr:hypothetical protein ANAPC1_00372 [Anaplasma phagocytophilum]
MAPVLCTWLMQVTGWKVAPGFCVMFWALIACIALSRITPKDIHRDWIKQ